MDLHQFTFERKGKKCYKVTYRTEARGDYYVTYVWEREMELIENTLNAKRAKAKDIILLRKRVVQEGAHYSKWGDRVN